MEKIKKYAEESEKSVEDARLMVRCVCKLDTHCLNLTFCSLFQKKALKNYSI